MGRAAVQTSLHYATGLPTDVSVNTLYFETPGAVDATISTDLLLLVGDFYNLATTTTENAISYYLSSYVSRTAPSVTQKVYDLDDPKPRPPVAFGDFELGAPGATSNLPTEVAACCSFRGDDEAGQSAARRRGRIYLGPIGTNALGASGQAIPARLADAFLTTIAEAAFRLASDSQSVAPWCVWSRTNAAMVPVRHGWVDNEPDTQRRRGQVSTNREAWSLSV